MCACPSAKTGVEAVGGRLGLVAELPSHPPVWIKGFSVLAVESKKLDDPDRAAHSRYDAA